MNIARSLLSRVWLAHALYFVLGGLWAAMSRRSFEWVTGPKTDYWLVRCVSGLLVAIGAVIGLAGARGRVTPEIRRLAIGSSAVLAATDLVYTATGRLRPTYLLDALANSILIGGWLARRDDGTPPNAT